MPVAGEGDLGDYLGLVRAISDPVPAVAPELEDVVHRFAAAVEAMPEVSPETVAALVHSDPAFVPVLASVVGLSQERLKRQLQMLTGSEAWVTKAANEPLALVGLLDHAFGVVDALAVARERTYTFEDVLIARASGRTGAGAGITAGRALEDQVEAVVKALELPYSTRTQFIGAAGRDGPADFAIPEGGENCRIAIGVKGFDSTGSKLTAAVEEVRRMVLVKTAGQYVFAIVDGQGWHGRRGDLGRLVELVQRREIDGMFPVAELDRFGDALRDAALRSRLLDP